MKIEGKVTGKGYPTIMDVENGDVFIFENDCNNPGLWMMIETNCLVCLQNGELMDADESYERRDIPVRIVNCTLVIND